MSYTKLLELEQRFSKKIAQSNDNIRFQEQRDRLSKFYHKLVRELNSIVSEMEGDIVALKARGLDPNTIKVFRDFRGHIINLIKNIDPEKPYEGTLKLIAWMHERMNKATLDNLNFIIQEHLKNNQVEFQPASFLSHVRVDSLSKIKNLLKSAHDYIEDNPLLPDPRDIPTVPPPVLRNVRDEEFTPASKDDMTVPGIPASKKEAV